MVDDLEFLDELYDKFCADEGLMELLGNPKTPKEKNERIHRTITPLDYATKDKVNFIVMHFSSATITHNLWVARGYLHIEYYTKNREDLKNIRRIVKRILEEEHLLAVSWYNVSSNVKGIIRYKDIFRPLCWA